MRALPAGVIPEVTAAALVPEVVLLATTLNIDAACVVIALLARAYADGNRSAARVFRAVLGKAPAEQVDAAMKALGL